jgi:SWI/SNF-related matrix-associated actin-dependent regulator 1 of chromatin subfamily A
MTTLADLLAGKAPEAPAPLTALPVPTLALPLLPYQQEAVEYALSRDSAYLALDMGLGKTACAIAVAVAYAKAGRTPTLVVVPPSLRTNWVREFAKFSPTTTVSVLKGGKPHALPRADVLIIGDSTLSKWAVGDAEKRGPFDLHGKVQALVVDEAHRHKNKSGRAEALVSLAKTVQGQRVLLSGTPMPNGRTMEMANQLSILGPSAWQAVGGQGRFWSRYAPKVDSWGTRGSEHLDEFGESMRSVFMMRRRREEVLTLPNKGRSSVVLDGQGEAVRKYKRAEQDLIQWLQEEGMSWQGAARAEALVRLTTLRKLAGESKVKSVAEHVEDLLDGTTGGVFIVAEHVSVMDALSLSLSKHGVVSVRGGMSDAAKQEAIDAFNSGKARVLVGQITSAGVGLTLHGDGKNYRVVFAQLPWTPAEFKQAEDRLHRIGQTHDVQVDVSLCHIDGSWTIDERLWGVLEQKAFATGVAIDGEGEVLLEDIQGGVLDSYR